jgi:hypothetical protein
VASLRFVLRVAACATALFALTVPVAHAGLVSGVLPGLVSPSDKPATCDTTASQPFARWGDGSSYVLVPGGSFEEKNLAGWTLGLGAKVVAGNEPYYVHSASDKKSLAIPAGSYATTPAMCFAFGDWHLRLFATSSSPSRLQVRVIVKSALGLVSALDGGSFSGSGTWAPSPRLGMLLTNICGLLATDAVSFQFVPSDGATWRIDDVYLDPWKSG